MKKARMNISHSHFILFKLKIFGEIVTTFFIRLYFKMFARMEHSPSLFQFIQQRSSIRLASIPRNIGNMMALWSVVNLR